jgi:hypothetical protein
MDGDARPRATVDELVELVVEELVPAAGWFRGQLARRLDVGLPGLAVLEDARRAPTTAARTALRTGMTPSAATKVITRLEAQGHVRRTPSGRHDQELLVELIPHEDRDFVLDGARARIGQTAQHVVSTLGLRDDDRGHVAVQVLVQVAHTLGTQAWEMEHRAATDAFDARRRRARERSGRRSPWDRP